MVQYGVGCFAKSLAGHDKDKVYVIVRVDQSYIYLADGSNKCIANPKRKKCKHVQQTGIKNKEIAEKQENGLQLTDEIIKRAIRIYCK